jgi:hypothetical protein
MNLSSSSSFELFVRMHKNLIKQILIVDILFFSFTSWYLFVPFTTGIYPFRTIVLLFLFILFFIGLHVRLASTNIGSTTFYRLLPIHSYSFSFRSHILIVFPFAAALLLILLLSSATSSITGMITIQTIERSFQIAAVFCTIKFLTLPTLLIIKKSIILLPFVYSLIIPIALIISAGNECIWGNFPLPEVWDMCIYVLLLFILETIIIKKVKAN